MTTTATLFLVLALTVVWGGLLAAIALLRRDSRDEATWAELDANEATARGTTARGGSEGTAGSGGEGAAGPDAGPTGGR